MGGETFRRFVIGVPLAVFAVAIIAIGGAVFAAAMAGFACVAIAEFFAIAHRARPFAAVAFIAAAGLILAAYFGDQYELVVVGLASLPLMFLAGAMRPSVQGLTGSFAVTALAVMWIGYGFAHAVLLRELPDHGAALLFDVLAATVVCDTAAYIGGRMIGQRPLAPQISPNKTWEGFFSGFAGATVAFWVAGLYQDWLPGLDALAMGAAIGLVAPAGDLFQSMIKRDLDVKDASNLFGPHGGVLDRLDAVLFTVVVGYYLSVALV